MAADTLPPPDPWAHDWISLAALPTAISCTRIFVARTLDHWGARYLEPAAQPLAVELVTHSLRACATPALPIHELDRLTVIQVRLLAFPHAVTIEVWDDAPEPAALADSQELYGRATDWGSTRTPHGRVTWAQLDATRGWTPP